MTKVKKMSNDSNGKIDGKRDDEGDDSGDIRQALGYVHFQPWNRHVKDSTALAYREGEYPTEYFKRLRDRYDILGSMESTRKHLTFYTHTNPFGCPWCELFVIAGLALKEGLRLAGEYEDLASREEVEEENA